eukprot:5995108-Amphidinium_carterae.1
MEDHFRESERRLSARLDKHEGSIKSQQTELRPVADAATAAQTRAAEAAAASAAALATTPSHRSAVGNSS